MEQSCLWPPSMHIPEHIRRARPLTARALLNGGAHSLGLPALQLLWGDLGA